MQQDYFQLPSLFFGKNPLNHREQVEKCVILKALENVFTWDDPFEQV